MTDDDQDDEPQDSVPYCRHFSDPADCDELCICGHKCCAHSYHSDYCEVPDCRCEAFQDKP